VATPYIISIYLGLHQRQYKRPRGAYKVLGPHHRHILRHIDVSKAFDKVDKIIIIIIASHEDEMNDKYNEKLCTSNEVIQRNE